MRVNKAKEVAVTVAPPYAVEMMFSQGERILGGGGGNGTSVDATLEGMSDFPPSGEHKLISITRHEGICFVAQLEREAREDGEGANESASLTVWAPTEQEARTMLQRTIRAHFSGPRWWEFDHPNYRHDAGTGRDWE